MKLVNANAIRARLITELLEFFTEKGEDVGLINSNTFNFPVIEGEEEGWIEIVVKVPKESGDEGYDKREEYKIKLAEKAEKAAKKEKEKEEKAAKEKAKKEKTKE